MRVDQASISAGDHHRDAGLASDLLAIPFDQIAYSSDERGMDPCGDRLFGIFSGQPRESIDRIGREPRQLIGTGGLGESRRLILELKSIADVGLIGMPNAGKSTMLSRLSRARPEIADYPFTTKFPNLGLVQSDMDRTFVLADIPGLIEGAAEGHGLGHDFLRHIMRAGILVHLVEPSPMDQTDPIGNYKTIRNELAHYSQELAQRPEIVVVTKAELPDAADIHAALSKELGRDDIHLVSAVTGSGLRQLVLRIADLLAEYRSATK